MYQRIDKRILKNRIFPLASQDYKQQFRSQRKLQQEDWRGLGDKCHSLFSQMIYRSMTISTTRLSSKFSILNSSPDFEHYLRNTLTPHEKGAVTYDFDRQCFQITTRCYPQLERTCSLIPLQSIGKPFPLSPKIILEVPIRRRWSSPHTMVLGCT